VLAIGEPILLKIYGLHGGVFGGLKVNDIKLKQQNITPAQKSFHHLSKFVTILLILAV